MTAPASPWTPVSEPPPHAGPWLVTDGVEVWIASYSYLPHGMWKYKPYWVRGEDAIDNSITHWMPLPELPK